MSRFDLAAIAAAVILTVPDTALAQAQLPSLPPPPQLAPAGRTPPSLPAPPKGVGQDAPQTGPQVQAPNSGPPSPPGPYTEVPVTMAGPVTDPSFGVFRKQLGVIASRKDRASLAPLIAPTFFWLTYQGDQLDKKKSAFENFVTAVELDAADGSGWEFLTTQAADPTLQPFKLVPGAQCAPAGPIFDYQTFDQLVRDTRTEVFEWAYTTRSGVPVRASAAPSAAVVERLNHVLVRILSDPEDTGGSPAPTATPPGPAQQQAEAPLPVVTPSGKTGWVSVDDVWRLKFDQICYAKDAAGWKITGYLGGG